jgi:hypothetical protein
MSFIQKSCTHKFYKYIRILQLQDKAFNESVSVSIHLKNQNDADCYSHVYGGRFDCRPVPIVESI